MQLSQPKKPFDIHVRRGGITHVCFLDLDTCTDFFVLCDEQKLFSSANRENRPFFFCFLSNQLADLILQRESFYKLFTTHRLEICIHSGKFESNAYAAQSCLLNEVKKQHESLDSEIKFTVVGGNHQKEFEESFSFLKSKKRDFMCIDPGHIWTGAWIDSLKKRIRDNSLSRPSDSVQWEIIGSVAQKTPRCSDTNDDSLLKKSRNLM